MLKKLSLSLIIPMISIYITSLLVDDIVLGDLSSVLILSIVLGALNMVLKPILKFIAFPITLLTLGAFGFLINGVLLYVAFALTPNVYISGIFPAVIASFIISIINCFLESILD